jgi:hypothetical protein
MTNRQIALKQFMQQKTIQRSNGEVAESEEWKHCPYPTAIWNSAKIACASAWDFNQYWALNT